MVLIPGAVGFISGALSLALLVAIIMLAFPRIQGVIEGLIGSAKATVASGGSGDPTG